MGGFFRSENLQNLVRTQSSVFSRTLTSIGIPAVIRSFALLTLCILTILSIQGSNAHAQTALPDGVFPTITMLPSSGAPVDRYYVVAYRNIQGSLDVLEFNGLNELKNQYTVFTPADSGVVSVLYPTVFATGSNKYIISAWVESSMAPGRGFAFAERQIGVSNYLSPPAPTSPGPGYGWCYGHDGTTVSGDGNLIFSSCHSEYNGWDAIYYFKNRSAGYEENGVMNFSQGGNQLAPGVVAIGDGSVFMGAWYDCPGGGTGDNCIPSSDVKGRVFDPNYSGPYGHFWSTDLTLNLTTTGNQGTFRGSWGRHENETFALIPFSYDPSAQKGRVFVTYLTDYSGATALTNVGILGVVYEYDIANRTLNAVTGELPIGDPALGNINFVSGRRLDNGSVLIAYTQDQGGVTAICTKVLDSTGSTIQSDTVVVPNAGASSETDPRYTGDIGAYAFPQITQFDSQTAKMVWQESVMTALSGTTFIAKPKIIDFSVGTTGADQISVP